MKLLYRYSIRRPVLTLVYAFLGVMAVAPGLIYLRLRTDGNALLPPRAPEVLADQAIRASFGLTDRMVVLVRAHHEDGIFNRHTLNLVADMTRKIAALPEVDPEDVISLATERSHRVRPGTLKFRAYLSPLPQTPDQLERLRRDLRKVRVYSGTLISFDEGSTCILVGVPSGVDRPGLHRKIEQLIRDTGEIPEEMAVVGGPVAESLMGTHILEDLGVPSEWQGSISSLPKVESPRSIEEWPSWVARQVGLMPLVIAIMFVLFYVTFRSLVAALLPLLEVGACLLFVFALMGWLGVPVYLTIAVMPVILTAVGIADEIHIFTCYRRLLVQHPNARHIVLVKRAMDEMWRPVLKTSITTAVAFGAFCLAPVRPIQAFGAFTAIGVLFCMIWSLTVIPACLVITPPSWIVRPSGRGLDAGSTRWLGFLAGACARRPWVCVLAALAIVAVAPFGLRRLSVQDSWIDGFAVESEFYQTTQFVNAAYAGAHILLVEVSGDATVINVEVEAARLGFGGIELPLSLTQHPEELVGQWVEARPTRPPKPRRAGDRTGVRRLRPARIESVEARDDRLIIKTERPFGRAASRRGDATTTYDVKISRHALLDPMNMQRVCALEEFIETHDELEVGGVLGPCDLLVTTSYMAHAMKESYRVMPETADRTLGLWRKYELVWGQRRLNQVIDGAHSRCLITVFLRNANYRAVHTLMNSIRDYEQQHLADHDLTLSFAGDVATSQAMIASIVSAQLRSLIGSLLGIVIVTTLLSRSLYWGLLCVLPCSLAVLMNFAVMGWLNIPLGVATSMFASMTLGIGVDYAIHVTERYRASRAGGGSVVPRVVDAITTAGPAILIDALAISLGFALLLVSAVPANARLGGLVVLSVLSCLIWTLGLVPSLLSIWKRHDVAHRE